MNSVAWNLISEKHKAVNNTWQLEYKLYSCIKCKEAAQVKAGQGLPDKCLNCSTKITKGATSDPRTNQKCSRQA